MDLGAAKVRQWQCQALLKVAIEGKEAECLSQAGYGTWTECAHLQKVTVTKAVAGTGAAEPRTHAS